MMDIVEVKEFKDNEEISPINAHMFIGYENKDLREYSLDKLWDVVCKRLKMPSTLRYSRTRKREYVYTRWWFFYFAYMYTKGTLTKLGEFFESETSPAYGHDTVLYGKNNVEEYVKLGYFSKDTYDAINDELLSLGYRKTNRNLDQWIKKK